MDIFSFLRTNGYPPSPTDEILYEYVAAELSNSVIKQGLWTKALADSEWNEQKAKSFYVKMRVAQLRSELCTLAANRQTLSVDPAREARAWGLSEEEIEYLRMPIKAISYTEKHGVSKDKLSKAIGLGKIRGVIRGDVLWVEDRDFSR
jgi:hypothetical protein